MVKSLLLPAAAPVILAPLQVAPLSGPMGGSPTILIQPGLQSTIPALESSPVSLLPVLGEKNVRVELLNDGQPTLMLFPHNRAVEALRLDAASLSQGDTVSLPGGGRLQVTSRSRERISLRDLVTGAQQWHRVGPPTLPAYLYRVTLTGRSPAKTLEVVVSALPDWRPDLDALRAVEQVLAALPLEVLGGLDRIRVNPFSSAQNAVASFNNGTMDVFPLAFTMPDRLLDLVRHEVGHALAWARFGQLDPGDAWREAMRRDGTRQPGFWEDQVDKSPSEDFADAVMLYLKTDRGSRDPSAAEAYSNRFNILDALLRGSF
jgi:hypothetical protein